jgi:hypothetical protein
MAPSRCSQTVSIRTDIQHNSIKETFYAYTGVMTSVHVRQPHPTLILARGFLYFVTFVSVYIILGSHMCHIASQLRHSCISSLHHIYVNLRLKYNFRHTFVTLTSQLRHIFVTFTSYVHYR